MNRHLHYQELQPGDRTKYHLAYAVAAPEASLIARLGKDRTAMFFAFNVRSKPLRAAILPCGQDNAFSYWDFCNAMYDFCGEEDRYTASLAYKVYVHLSGIGVHTEDSKLPMELHLDADWAAQLK